MKEESGVHSASSDKEHWDLCHGIVEVFYAVYNELGYGFLEAVYEEALSLALMQAGFTVSRQVPTPIWFRGQEIGDYKADLIVNNCVLVELKNRPCDGAGS
jgi:GxxExxY protein